MKRALPRWLSSLYCHLCLWVVLMTAWPLHAQGVEAAPSTPAQLLTLTADAGLRQSAALAGHLSSLRDLAAELEIADIADATRLAARHGEFIPLKGYVFDGFTQAAIWVRFTLQRAADAPAMWYLEVTPTFLDDVTLFAPDGKGGFNATALGDRKPFADRPVRSRTFVFPLELEARPTTFYLRVKTTTSLNLQARLWQQAGMVDARESSDLASGIVAGAVGIMFFFNLIFWVWLKDRVHLYYAAYLATLAINMTFLNGYAARWWFEDAPWLADQGVGIGICLNVAAAVLFTSKALNLRQLLPLAQRMYDGIFVLFVIALMFALAGHYELVAPYVNVGALFVTAVGMPTAGLLLWRGHREHLLYVLAFSVFAAAHMFFMLRILSVIDLGDLVDPMVQVGTVLHVVLLSIALVDRVRTSERNYREERRRALQTAQQAERALELNVAERTISLEQEVDRRGALESQLRDALTSEQRALAEQRQFVAMVSHEFRTPLAIINAAAQSLSVTRSAQEPPVQERVRKIGRAVARLSAMIDNYLTEDKLSMDALPLNAQALDLRTLIEESLQTLDEAAADRISFDAGDAAITVQCDRPLVVVALSNLVQNALKYSPTQAGVGLRMHVSEGMACVDVEDFGDGIDTDDVARLFDKYFRARNTGQVAGTGLGLYLARVIAQRHGGNVSLLRTGVAGSVFRLALPVASDR